MSPQVYAEALAARLSLESADELSFFWISSILPTSNIGPGLLNGVTWYVWDDITGAYIPQVIASGSLRFIAQNATPDPALYIFWIYLDGTGKAQDIRYYSGGAWKSIFEDKFGEYSTTTVSQAYTNAQIAAAIGDIPAPDAAVWYPFRAQKNAVQDIVFPGAGNVIEQITFPSEIIDPNSVFAVNQFVVPVGKGGAWSIGASIELGVTSGSPTQTDFSLEILVNGGVECSQILPIDSTDTRIYNIATMLKLVAGDVVTVSFDGTTDAACTVRVNSDSDTNFWGRLVQVI